MITKKIYHKNRFYCRFDSRVQPDSIGVKVIITKNLSLSFDAKVRVLTKVRLLEVEIDGDCVCAEPGIYYSKFQIIYHHLSPVRPVFRVCYNLVTGSDVLGLSTKLFCSRTKINWKISLAKTSSFGVSDRYLRLL